MDPAPCGLSPQADPAPQPSFNLAQNKHIPHLFPKLPSASDNNSKGKAQRIRHTLRGRPSS